MNPKALKQARQALGLTQEQLAEKLRLKRLAVTRYEGGTRRIPGMVEVMLQQLTAVQVPMAGVVAAGEPIEPIPQTELVEVLPSMVKRGKTYLLRVKGDSMRDEGILPGDTVVVHKQSTAQDGDTIIALVNNEATIKKYFRKNGVIELHPANESMKPIIVRDTDTFQIQGVMVGLIRHLRK